MEPPDHAISCRGFCSDCGEEHSLPFGAAMAQAKLLMAEFRSLKRLDYRVAEDQADPGLSLATLLPGDRGHMFGVLECRTGSGETAWLRAFSSLATGVRTIDGWVPHLLPEADFQAIVLPEQQEIKRLTREKNNLPSDAPDRQRLERERRTISRNLMPRIHDLYHFTNFRGDTRSLRQIFPAERGIPGGVGDCCAPKLLVEAAKQKLQPVSLAEFYWGGSNRSGNKQAGQFFPACEEKCQPILGFLLCGAEPADSP